VIREKKKLQTRAGILRAALHVFACNGYENAKLDQISKLAKVGKGTIYNHFQSKASLFFAVQEDTLESFLRFWSFEQIRTPAQRNKSKLRSSGYSSSFGKKRTGMFSSLKRCTRFPGDLAPSMSMF